MRGRGLHVIVFDFDGVIVESNDVKTDAFRDVFARFPEHLDAMMAFHHANVSASRFVKFDHLIRDRLGRGDDPALRDELAAEYSRRTIDRIVDVPLVPGAREMLEEFSAHVPLYLASVTPQQDLDTILERRDLKRFFRVAYGCPPWTKARAILDAIGRERRAPEEVALVGDSPGDQTAAREAGVEFVARNSGIKFPSPPDSFHADLFAIADSLRPRLP